MRPVPFDEEPLKSPLNRCQSASLLVYDELTPPERLDFENVLLDLFEIRIGAFKPGIITSNLSNPT